MQKWSKKSRLHRGESGKDIMVRQAHHDKSVGSASADLAGVLHEAMSAGIVRELKAAIRAICNYLINKTANCDCDCDCDCDCYCDPFCHPAKNP